MLSLSDYDYELPDELIAQEPLASRSDARLLVVDRQDGSLQHCHVRDLPDFLTPRDALVLNNTRVIPARLVGYRTATKGRWNGLYLQSDERGTWLLLSKTRGKLRAGETVMLEDRSGRDDTLLRLIDKRDDGVWSAYPETDEPLLQLLQRVGRVPLPHYIRGGEMVPADQEAYQTVFAENNGAVAAPTAGLHLTRQLLDTIQAPGVAIVKVTLHVGIGTFRPMTEATLARHVLHREWCSVSAEAAEQMRQRREQGGRIVAVGTTVVRTVESVASECGRLRQWEGETDLFVRPPFEFRAVDALMTNFHLPKSTLLVLVRTFAGDELMRRAYEEAIQEKYRFFSYGDAMLIV